MGDKFILLSFVITLTAQAGLKVKTPVIMAEGKNFSIPATQEIKFVPLKKIDATLYNDPSLPRIVDLKRFQSSIKNQGNRGACTYFALTSLVESLIKRAMNKDVDVSEEYLAWAAKTKMKLRSQEEDSSIAVNAATIQAFGFLSEKDLPYQPSWFEKGFHCEGQREKSNIDSICYSHDGPTAAALTRVMNGKNFVFEAVDSKSIDIVRSLARTQNAVTLSLLGHKEMWGQTYYSGAFSLTKKSKRECQKNTKRCGGHVVLVVGYDLNKRVFFIKNSWGEEWGQKGYGTIPFDYVDQMSARKFLTGHIDGTIDIRSFD